MKRADIPTTSVMSEVKLPKGADSGHSNLRRNQAFYTKQHRTQSFNVNSKKALQKNPNHAITSSQEEPVRSNHFFDFQNEARSEPTMKSYSISARSKLHKSRIRDSIEIRKKQNRTGNSLDSPENTKLGYSAGADNDNINLEFNNSFSSHETFICHNDQDHTSEEEREHPIWKVFSRISRLCGWCVM